MTWFWTVFFAFSLLGTIDRMATGKRRDMPPGEVKALAIGDFLLTIVLLIWIWGRA